MTVQFGPPGPYLIPGYTGFVPNKIFMCGDTFGRLTHKVLMDPLMHWRNKAMNEDVCSDESRTFHKRHLSSVPVYQYPIIPGYAGHVPMLAFREGKRYTQSATEAICHFDNIQEKHWNHQKKQASTSIYPLPLTMVHPPGIGGIRHGEPRESFASPAQRFVSPYFSDESDSEKYFKSGYTGHVPGVISKVGLNHQAANKEALLEFTKMYRSYPIYN